MRTCKTHGIGTSQWRGFNYGASDHTKGLTSMLIIGPAPRVIHSDVSRWLISMTWAHQSPTGEAKAGSLMLSLVVASSHDVAAARERAEFGFRMQLHRSRAYREKIHSFISPARSNHVLEEALMSTVRTMF